MNVSPLGPLDPTEVGYQRLAADIYPRLVEQIALRYRNSAGKSLQDVYNLDPAFLGVDADMLDFVTAYRSAMLAALDDPALLASLARLFVLSSLEFTFANNQFIYVDQTEQDILYQLYCDYLAAMRRALAGSASLLALRRRLEAVIGEHFTRLHANLARFIDPASWEKPDQALIFRQVVCREYSPTLQLALLGVNLESLAQPVLDLGCGKSGRLVQDLRARGVEAWGVDRIVDEAPYLQPGDWLTLRLAPAAWGSVLSHLAFSNHFNFHHLYRYGRPEPYARQYRAILNSLRPGGSFYYAPGLPFIEQALPETTYRVMRRPIHTVSLAAAEEWVDGAGGIYAAQVIKLAANRGD